MNELDMATVAIDMVNEQKASFKLLWILGTTIVSTLTVVVAYIARLYIKKVEDSHNNEKETIKVIEKVTTVIETANETNRTANELSGKILEKINNPIIPTLTNIEKDINKS